MTYVAWNSRWYEINMLQLLFIKTTGCALTCMLNLKKNVETFIKPRQEKNVCFLPLIYVVCKKKKSKYAVTG